MTPAQFIAKWERVTLPERAASQEYFTDLCRLLGQPFEPWHVGGHEVRVAFGLGLLRAGPSNGMIGTVVLVKHGVRCPIWARHRVRQSGDHRGNER